MQAPDSSDGWIAQIVYLGTVGLAGLVAWVSQYRHGRRSESDEPDARGKHIILEGAELADMHAVRSLVPELRQIGVQLNQIMQVVQDNHRIVENNEKMLILLQKIDRAMEVEKEVESQRRQDRLDDAIKGRDGR